jgi:hypothetical protein
MRRRNSFLFDPHRSGKSHLTDQGQLDFKLPRKKRAVHNSDTLNARVAAQILDDDFAGRYEATDEDLPQIFFLDVAAQLQVWEDLKNGT